MTKGFAFYFKFETWLYSFKFDINPFSWFSNMKMFSSRTFRCIRKIEVIPPYSRLKRPNASIKRAKYTCQKSPLHFVTCGLKHFQLKANLWFCSCSTLDLWTSHGQKLTQEFMSLWSVSYRLSRLDLLWRELLWIREKLLYQLGGFRLPGQLTYNRYKWSEIKHVKLLRRLKEKI